MTPPNSLIPWLYHPCSLTEKLASIADVVTINVLSMAWSCATPQSQMLFGAQVERVFVREVMVYGDNTPYWYAKTLIPDDTLIEHPWFIDALQATSMATLLFQDERITRQTPVIQRFKSPDGFSDQSPLVWGRSTMAEIGHQPIPHRFQVNELFLVDRIE